MAIPGQSVKISKTIKSDHPEKAFQQLDMMRKEGRFTDTLLMAEGRQFPAHRAVLCACSSYFDRMFQPGFVEQENNVVDLKDFDADTLATLLEYMYTAKLTITEENAQDMLIGANLLLLYNVREAAGEVLSKMIDDNNVLIIRSLGSVFSCREVESRAHNYMLERFEFVSKTEEFLKLDAKEVEKYLSMDDIIVKSEESIFQCIVRWIEVDRDQRRKHFDELVQTVRFPLVTEHYLKSEILNHELVKDSSCCQQIIQHSSLLKAQHKFSRPFLPPGSTLPQYRGSNQLLFLQCSNNSPWLKTPPVLYDFKKLSWSSLGGPHSPCRYREDSSFVFFNNSVLSIGGEYTQDGSEHGNLPLPPHFLPASPVQIVLDKEVYSFSLEERIWSVHSYLVTPRKRHQSVVLGGKCYVIGGYNHCSQPLDSVEVIQLESSSPEWSEAAPMLSKRVSHGAVELNGCLYVVGGWDGQGVVKTVEKFSPEQGTWQEVSSNPDIRMKSGVATLDGKLYVVGGCLQTLEACYRAEVFDPITREWIRLSDTNHARANPVLVPYRGKLYLFGGEGNSQGMVECFDPYTNTWTVLDTRIKHFVNGAYAGCLVEKPWDWDIQHSREAALNSNMKRILSNVGLDVVQNIRNHYYNDFHT